MFCWLHDCSWLLPTQHDLLPKLASSFQICCYAARGHPVAVETVLVLSQLSFDVQSKLLSPEGRPAFHFEAVMYGLSVLLYIQAMRFGTCDDPLFLDSENAIA